MIVVGLVLTGLAALFHVYVFYLESVAWTSPRGRAAFGMTAEEAQATKLLAFNQGFYNLFLALAIVVGTVLVAADTRAVGATLVIAGAAMMVGGNIKGETRVLTTATVLEVSRGHFDIAFALSFVLLAITYVVTFLLTLLQRQPQSSRG